VRHLVDQRLGETQMPVAAVRGVIPGQGDLGGQPPTAPRRRQSRGSLGVVAHRRQLGGQSGLQGGGPGFGAFEFGDAGDQRRLIGEIHSGPNQVEHTFDCTRLFSPPQAPTAAR
jgi:hypothetical protein